MFIALGLLTLVGVFSYIYTNEENNGTPGVVVTPQTTTLNFTSSGPLQPDATISSITFSSFTPTRDLSIDCTNVNFGIVSPQILNTMVLEKNPSQSTFALSDIVGVIVNNGLTDVPANFFPVSSTNLYIAPQNTPVISQLPLTVKLSIANTSKYMNSGAFLQGTIANPQYMFNVNCTSGSVTPNNFIPGTVIDSSSLRIYPSTSAVFRFTTITSGINLINKITISFSANVTTLFDTTQVFVGQSDTGNVFPATCTIPFDTITGNYIVTITWTGHTLTAFPFYVSIPRTASDLAPPSNPLELSDILAVTVGNNAPPNP